MIAPERPQRMPVFEPGAMVRVKYGVADPDFLDIPVGGWAGTIEMVEQVFDQSARKGMPRGLGGLSDTVNGPEWAAAAGLLLWGFRNQKAKGRKRPRTGLARVADSVRAWFAAN